MLPLPLQLLPLPRLLLPVLLLPLLLLPLLPPLVHVHSICAHDAPSAQRCLCWQWKQCYPRVVEPEQLYPDMDTDTLEQEHTQHQQELNDLMQHASQKETELAEMGRRKKDLATACREKQGQLKQVCKLKEKLLKELRGMSPKKRRPQRPTETEEDRVARMERETYARIAEQKKAELAAYAAPDAELNDLMAIFGQSPPVSKAPLRSAPPVCSPTRARPAPPAVQHDYQDSMASPIDLGPTQPEHHNVTVPVARTIGPARARIRARNAKMSRQQSSVSGNGQQMTQTEDV